MRRIDPAIYLFHLTGLESSSTGLRFSTKRIDEIADGFGFADESEFGRSIDRELLNAFRPAIEDILIICPGSALSDKREWRISRGFCPRFKTERSWWVAAEQLVGFYNGYQLTVKPDFKAEKAGII